MAGFFAGLILAIIAGFATQRGTICAVAAVDQALTRGDGRRFLALLEAGVWAVLVLIVARAAGVDRLATMSGYEIGLASALGGAVFGVGAVLNGACAFGSAAKLGQGDLAFIGTAVGIYFGALGAHVALDGPEVADTAGPIVAAPLAAIMAVALGFMALQTVRSVRSGGLTRPIRTLLAPRWAPSLAVAAIGAANGLMALVIAAWPFSTLLTELAVTGHAGGAVLKVALALALVGGAALGALTSGRFRLRLPRLGYAAEKLGAGGLMGVGAYLVPGGNDALVLFGVPLLQPHALAAFVTMTAAIAAATMLTRALRRA